MSPAIEQDVIRWSRRGHSPTTIAALVNAPGGSSWLDSADVQRIVAKHEAMLGTQAKLTYEAAERARKLGHGVQRRSLDTVLGGLGLPRPWGRYAI